MDILDECEKVDRAYRACPRWRLFKRRALRDHWLMCCSILAEFEEVRIAVQREMREAGVTLYEDAEQREASDGASA